MTHERNEAGTKPAGPRLVVRQGSSVLTDAARAVDELAAQIDQDDARVNLVFFSDDHDPEQLGKALRPRFRAPVVGCTTAVASDLPETEANRAVVALEPHGASAETERDPEAGKVIRAFAQVGPGVADVADPQIGNRPA